MDTKGHCFPESIIIQAVYLKLRFTLSYRDDDGSNLIELYDVTSIIYSCWSPDGKKIAGIDNYYGYWDIWVLDLSTHDRTYLTSDIASQSHLNWGYSHGKN